MQGMSRLHLPARGTLMRTAAAVAVTGCLAVLLAGCGSKRSNGSGGGSGGGSGSSYTVHATDFRYDQGLPQVVKAGKAHFQLVNDSKTYQHELWIFPAQQPKLQELIAQKEAGNDVNEENYLQNIAGKVEDLDPGKSGAFDVNLPPGTYEVACFITSKLGDKTQAHYSLGMHSTITVQ